MVFRRFSWPFAIRSSFRNHKIFGIGASGVLNVPALLGAPIWCQALAAEAASASWAGVHPMSPPLPIPLLSSAASPPERSTPVAGRPCPISWRPQSCQLSGDAVSSANASISTSASTAPSSSASVDVPDSSLSVVDPLAPLQQSSEASDASLQQLRSRLNRITAALQPFADEAVYPVTRLRGEAIYGLETINTLNRVDDKDPAGKHFFIGYRLRLNIDTTFNGQDRLRIRLQSRTIPELETVTGSPLVNLSFDGDDGSKVEISDLWYRFSISRRTELTLSAIGASLRDSVPAVNPLFYGSSRGSISVFGSEDPILRGVGGVGLSLSHDFSSSLNLTAAGVSRDRSATDSTVGLPGDRRAGIVQITYSPTASFKAALAWNASRNEGFLRSQFDDSDSVSGNALSGEIYYRPWNAFAFGVRAGLVRAVADDLDESPQRSFVSYAATIGFPDLGGKDNLLGFVIGRPPYLNAGTESGFQAAVPFHLEAFYRYNISDVLAVTPGLMFIQAPTDEGGLQDYWVGALRMTFRF